MHIINDFLTDTRIDRVDRELILAHHLRQDRAWIITHTEHPLDDVSMRREIEYAFARRATHEPLAYITGYKDFYNHTFCVTPDTLIPRPESELFVDLVQGICDNVDSTILCDIGTGSGCIAISCALTCPDTITHTIATDIDINTLAVAQKNKSLLAPELPFTFITSNLLKSATLQKKLSTAHLESTTLIITANLPYVDRTWKNELLMKESSKSLAHEPPHALWADYHGIALYREFFAQFKEILPSLKFTDIHIFCEINDHQYDLLVPEIQNIFSSSCDITAHHDLADHRRIISFSLSL